MIPPVPTARFKRITFTPYERIRSHSLIFFAGMMDRGAIRKGGRKFIQDGTGLTWTAKCVQWSGGTPIWEICGQNDYPKAI